MRQVIVYLKKNESDILDEQIEGYIDSISSESISNYELLSLREQRCAKLISGLYQQHGPEIINEQYLESLSNLIQDTDLLRPFKLFFQSIYKASNAPQDRPGASTVHSFRQIGRVEDSGYIGFIVPTGDKGKHSVVMFHNDGRTGLNDEHGEIVTDAWIELSRQEIEKVFHQALEGKDYLEAEELKQTIRNAILACSSLEYIIGLHIPGNPREGLQNIGVPVFCQQADIPHGIFQENKDYTEIQQWLDSCIYTPLDAKIKHREALGTINIRTSHDDLAALCAFPEDFENLDDFEDVSDLRVSSEDLDLMQQMVDGSEIILMLLENAISTDSIDEFRNESIFRTIQRKTGDDLFYIPEAHFIQNFEREYN